MKVWYSVAELIGLPGLPGTRSGLLRAAQREGWRSRPRSGRGGGREYHRDDLPELTHAHFDRLERATAAAVNDDPEPEHVPAPDVLWEQYEAASDKHKRTAQTRAAILHEIAREVAAGAGVEDALSSASRRHRVAARTLRKWRRRVRDIEPHLWLAALVPEYRGGGRRAGCSPEAWETIKADYLRPEQPCFQACYERLERAAKKHGWTIPSKWTLLRRVRRELPRTALVMAREGREMFDRTMPAQKRDRSVFRALEAVNADGHRFDVFVRWPDGTIARPQMVAWQDLFSGKLLSYRVDRTENVDSVRLAFGDLVERFGVPEHAYLDNGRAFASKWMTGGVPNRYRFKVKEEEPAGLLTSLGVEVHWTQPYHGQAKPIERAFRDLCEYVAKHPAFAGAYTGNNPTAKPENYGSRAVPLADFLAVLEQEIKAHNARPGRRSEACGGRSLDETFNESYAVGPVKKATEGQRRMWLLAAEAVRADRTDGSVWLSGNRYWREPLAEIAGDRVIVRFDPDAMHGTVHVYTMDGAYVTEADCIQSVGFSDTESARAHAQAVRSRRRATRELLESERKLDALELAAKLPDVEEAETPEPAVVHLTRPRLMAAGGSGDPESLLESDDEETREDAIRQLFAAGLRRIRSQ